MRFKPGTVVDAYGDKKPASAWARDPRCAVPRETFYGRMAAGRPSERARSDPSRKTRTTEAFGERKSLRDSVIGEPLEQLSRSLETGAAQFVQTRFRWDDQRRLRRAASASAAPPRMSVNGSGVVGPFGPSTAKARLQYPHELIFVWSQTPKSVPFPLVAIGLVYASALV